jgi:hypothetical protein
VDQGAAEVHVTSCATATPPLSVISRTRHCEERSDDAIQFFPVAPGLLRFARNDEFLPMLRFNHSIML